MLKNIGAILKEAGATFNNGKKHKLDSCVLHVKSSCVLHVVVFSCQDNSFACRDQGLSCSESSIH